MAKRYNVIAYPTFLFVTPEGYVAHRGMGGMKKAEDFIALGKEALKIGHNGHEERFAKGERNEAFLKEYFQEMLTLHLADQAETTLGQLYQEQGRKILRDKDYWTVFDCCAEDIDSPLSLAFLKDYKKLCKIHGAFAVDQKTRNLYATSCTSPELPEIFCATPRSASLQPVRPATSRAAASTTAKKRFFVFINVSSTCQRV